MNSAAIIGAGQLGSRHLQGLKTASLPFDIWVVDQSRAALETARERYEQVERVGEKSLHLTESIEDLPKRLDFVVVATGSLPRAALVKQLLAHATVRYMVLEKVLFPRLSEYDEIGKLLEQTGTRCWVNCARRLFAPFHQAREVVAGSPVDMRYDDTNWGLCCNSIHYIDIFMMITGEDSYTLDTGRLIPVIEESKRKGYIEFFGELTATTPGGSRLVLRCRKEEVVERPVLTIENGAHRVVVDEPQGILDIDGRTVPFRIPYQSETTGVYADLVMKTGHCGLPTYTESARYHTVFLREMLKYYNRVGGTDADLLPIT